MEAIIAILVVDAVASAGFSAYLARQKGRDPTSWAVLGFFFGVLALIGIAGAPIQGYSRQRDRVCPMCWELVFAEAKVCPQCQSDLPPAQRCEYERCEKVVNTSVARYVDDSGRVFCSYQHKRWQLDLDVSDQKDDDLEDEADEDDPAGENKEEDKGEQAKRT